MTDWFDKTNAEKAFSSNGATRTVLHGLVEDGEPLAAKNFIIALSGVRHDDAADFLRNKADDAVWDDVSDAFDALYKNLVDKNDHMWLTNLTKKADRDDNDTNSQVQEVHIHVLSGALQPDKEFIGETRSFHPHPNKDVYKLFAENRHDVLGIDMGEGIKAVPLPSGVKEAQQHFALVNDNYASFPDFIEKASREEKRAFWKAVAKLALPLVENGKGARVGYYNLKGAADAKAGRMVVEIAGGENLGQNGARKRWYRKPAP